LPTSSGTSSPSVPVTDRGNEKVNIGFSDFRTGGGDQLRDPRLVCAATIEIQALELSQRFGAQKDPLF
jgi:hypothetical protein